MGLNLVSVVHEPFWSKEILELKIPFIMVDIRTLLESGLGEQAARLPTVRHSKGKREF